MNESMQTIWEKKSSLRTRPRRLLELADQSPYFFPMSKQPLCFHPLITDLGDEAVQYILIQSAYKFMGDIALIETDVVNTSASKITNDKLSISFPMPIRHDVLTVIMDEAYHAYVAIDFMQQVEQATHVVPLEVICETGLSHAMKEIGKALPLEQRGFFDVMAVCIGENSITKELVNVTRDANVNKFFNEVNEDHALDEGRHCGIFASVLTYLWEHITHDDRDIMSSVIPPFIYEYLKPDFQRDYNRKILTELGLAAADIDQIIYDTHIDYTPENFRLVNPIVENINKLFKRTGVFSHQKMVDSFQKSGLL